jgi:nucleotide-binding universal stress UspA family protein
MKTILVRCCHLLVTGAYAQSRLRRMIFGDVAYYILAHATLLVFMAH